MKDIDRILLLVALVLLLLSVSGNVKGWQISFGFAACRADTPAKTTGQVLEQSQQRLGLTSQRYLQEEVDKELQRQLDERVETPSWAKPKEKP